MRETLKDCPRNGMSPMMVVASVHSEVISALLNTLFPALPEEAKAARNAGQNAVATFFETPGGKDPEVAQLVRQIDIRTP